jgi:hypothetical protein
VEPELKRNIFGPATLVFITHMTVLGWRYCGGGAGLGGRAVQQQGGLLYQN